jgi:SNF2 family DNA or RNA helicase
MKYVPHSYQADAIRFLLQIMRAALFLDMGLGKTSITLSAIRTLVADGQIQRVLVIAPKRVADNTWTDEAQKWAHTSDLVFVRVLGSASERLAALATPGHVFLVNRENVKWLVEHCAKAWPFDMVVIDESSSFKDHGSQRFKALRKVCRKPARIVLLTGTPTPNNYLELWPQFYLLDQGDRLGPTFGGYRDAYFSPDRRSRDRIYSWKLDPGAREIIENKIADITLSLRAEDYLTLPPRVDNVIPIRLSPAARRAYDEFERHSVLDIADQGVITAANAAALANKLAQASNGAVYDEYRKVHELHSEKLDALAEILDTATSPVLVAYMYRHDLARLKSRFPQAVEIGEDGAIEQWNAGQIPVLLAHPASAGHGLNLQAGGSTVVWFGLTWSNELHLQFNARLHRQGQQRPVVVSYLVADGTVDQDILDALDDKHAAQEVLLDALRRRANSFVSKEHA